MGVVSFFDILGTKKESTPDFSKNFLAVDQALADVFKTIAAEKNRMIYQPTSELVNNIHHHTIVAAAAKKLVASLHNLNPPSLSLPELAAGIKTLEEAIDTYQKSELALSQLILACSSIKMSLEKKRPIK